MPIVEETSAGGLVIEVNTLNPGGVFWSEHFTAPDIASRIVASLERTERS